MRSQLADLADIESKSKRQ